MFDLVGIVWYVFVWYVVKYFVVFIVEYWVVGVGVIWLCYVLLLVGMVDGIDI